MRARLPYPVVSKEEVSPLGFFETSHEVFKKAELSAGREERDFHIGGVAVKLRFAGPALVPLLTKALSHVAAGEVPGQSLTVCIWDDASTNTAMPPPPWADCMVHDASGVIRSVYTRRGDVRGFNDGRIRTAYNWGAGALSILDTERGLALYWTHDARRLPSYESSAPLRTILHWWLSGHGGQLVHAAAVGTAGGGVLLAGKGGSGKSTAALSCLDSELLYVSDDYCLISTEPRPYVHSIYSSAKVDADNLHRVPHLLPALDDRERVDGEKAVFFLAPHFSGKIVSGFPIRAILLPSITGRVETTVTPATPLDGIRALALSTVSQLAGAHRSSVKRITELVGKVPCYHLGLGTDLGRIPAVISGLLSHRQPSGHDVVPAL